MGRKLLKSKLNSCLGLIKVQNNHVHLLIELDHLRRVINSAPREVGYVYESVYAAKINKDPVASDVLDHPFKDLTLLEQTNNFALLLLEVGLNKGLVRNNNILELVVDFNNLEFHGLVNVDVVIANWLDVDLRPRQESLKSKYVDNHAALGTRLDITLNDFFGFKCLVDTVPCLNAAGLAVRQHELSELVFLLINQYFNQVSNLEIGIVAELVHRNHSFRL